RFVLCSGGLFLDGSVQTALLPVIARSADRATRQSLQNTKRAFLYRDCRVPLCHFERSREISHNIKVGDLSAPLISCAPVEMTQGSAGRSAMRLNLLKVF
ncbi:MAG: hypothetical protein LBL66_08005, partial [Clostridiales bacterium]|nr:hypothetical protein [Clostridiales bacterium]